MPTGKQIEQRLVARAFAARRRLGRRQPFGRRGGRFARSRCGQRFDDGFAVTSTASLPFSVSSRADNCRASSSKAWFSTGVSAGCFASPGSAERQDVCGGICRHTPLRFPSARP
jgi:hypothetical protein